MLDQVQDVPSSPLSSPIARPIEATGGGHRGAHLPTWGDRPEQASELYFDVKRKDEDRHDEHGTKRLVLEAYEGMDGAEMLHSASREQEKAR